MSVAKFTPAARTLQLAVPALAPHPQIQGLVLLVDLVTVNGERDSLVIAGFGLIRYRWATSEFTRKPVLWNACQSAGPTISCTEPLFDVPDVLNRWMAPRPIGQVLRSAQQLRGKVS